jgi:hydroxycarboxylate dehydrogenase B
MKVIKAEQLERIASDIFQGAGLSADEAGIVAKSLVKSNLMGHDSHGVIRIPDYCKLLKEGMVKAGQKVRVEHETDASSVLDGGWGFGQVICRQAMEVTLEKAKKRALAAVTLRQCAHIGRLGEYAEMAAEKNMIGIVMCNDHGSTPSVAPFGGIDGRMSTNPIAIGIPTGGPHPIIIDMATSVVAAGKIHVQLNRDEKMPEGWALDSTGNPTTDPKATFGPPPGAILPFGGISAHKGFGLSIAVDLLSGALGGAGCTRENAESEGNGVFLLVLDIGAFQSTNDFKAEADAFIEYIKSSRLMPGFDEILIPGEPEYRRRRQLETEGIKVEETTWRQIVETAGSFKVEIELT